MNTALRWMLFLGAATLLFIFAFHQARGADFTNAWSKNQREDMWGRCMSQMTQVYDFDRANIACQCAISEMEKTCPSYKTLKELADCLDEKDSDHHINKKCLAAKEKP